MVIKLKTKKRVASRKIWIKDIIDSKFVKSPGGWEPSYIEVDGEKISRVNVVATVVSKFLSEDGNYGSVTLDDGTETIRVKAFGPDVVKLKNIMYGSIVRFIGKAKEYNEETYLSPEIVRALEDQNWLVVHKLEVGQPKTGAPKPEDVKPDMDEEVAIETIKNEDISVQKKVLDIIRSLDAGGGAEVNGVVERSKLGTEDAMNIIVGLLKVGDVYEPVKGRLKALD